MLDFGHLELSHSDQTISGCNLVPEAKTDLGSGKGNPTTVELIQLVEVDEHALSSLGSKVTN